MRQLAVDRRKKLADPAVELLLNVTKPPNGPLVNVPCPAVDESLKTNSPLPPDSTESLMNVPLPAVAESWNVVIPATVAYGPDRLMIVAPAAVDVP